MTKIENSVNSKPFLPLNATKTASYSLEVGGGKQGHVSFAKACRYLVSFWYGAIEIKYDLEFVERQIVENALATQQARNFVRILRWHWTRYFILELISLGIRCHKSLITRSEGDLVSKEAVCCVGGKVKH